LPSNHVVMLTPHGDPLGRIGEPDIGGQCVYVRELSKHLSAAGIRVTVFTRDRSDGRPPQEDFAERASIIRIPCGPSGFVPKEEILPYLDEFAERAVATLAGDEILHSHYWDGGYVASRIRSSQPWFHSTHSLGKVKMQSLPDAERYQYADRIRIEEDVYRACDCVIGLTQIEKRQITSHYGVPAERICVIPPGVDTRVFRPREPASTHRRRLGLQDRLTVLSLGRLDERKGLDLFVRAAARVVAQTELTPTSFVMSAGHGSDAEASENEKIARLIDELDVSAHLTWLPVLDEDILPQYYNASDLFVLPSRYEPFGIVMLEAMASGIPVVSTDNGGPAEVIDDGVDGLLGNPEDSEEFATLIASLIADDEKRSAFGGNAHRKAVEQYGWDAIASRFEATYREKGAGGGDDAR